jgi:hypothetical protein
VGTRELVTKERIHLLKKFLTIDMVQGEIKKTRFESKRSLTKRKGTREEKLSERSCEERKSKLQ